MRTWPTPRQVSQVTGFEPLRRPRSFALLAFARASRSEVDGVAEHGLFEVEFQLVAQVRATEHLRTAAPTAAEDVAEHVAENVAEGVARIEAAPPPPRDAASTPAWPYWSYAARFCGSDRTS